MQFPESWLREFCDPPIGTAELAERLTMAGLEVEGMRSVAPPFHGVVVGKVLSAEPHPNADRLRVCEVDVGATEQLAIVCGAPNVRVGMKAPVALVGAELPAAGEGSSEPLRIEVGRIRGVESRGMLCSARELKLTDDHEGLLVLDEDAVVGADIRATLGLDDTVFTLKLTPNLGHALSVFGVAREVAAITGAPLRTPTFAKNRVDSDRILPVRVEAPDLCGRFSGRVVLGVDPRVTTPRWMVDRLARCGQRSVSPLVDISNYVMFELGRPSHIFDLDKIQGSLAVRWGRGGESLELLNGSTVEVDPTVGVIADETGVESLAGIMGGAATAVTDATRNVYVEAAFWWPEAVAGRSRRYHFSTDAGHRFERGVDPATTVEHIERLTSLVVAICGGRATHCGPIDDHVVALPQQHAVTLRVARAAKVIGMPVTQADCERVFTRLGFTFTSRVGEIDVVPPSWRFDLRIEEDLIEEVIRLLGYDALPTGPARGPLHASVTSERERPASALRHAMARLGWQETISFSFVDERWEHDFAGNDARVRVVNPIAAAYSVMRSSLIGSLVESLRVNLARKVERVRVFELGKVFVRDERAASGPLGIAGLRQPLMLGGLACGPAAPAQWGVAERDVDLFDVKGDLEALFAPAFTTFVPAPHPALHPGRSAAIELDGHRVGVVGELHPRWRQAYELPASVVVFEIDAGALMQRALPSFVALPKQQSAWRDIAVVAGRDVHHDAIMSAIAAAAESAVRDANLFDIFEPKDGAAGIAAGERSLTIRLELRDDGRTLTDEQIDRVVAAVVASLRQRLGVRLRQQ
ncbi:MAG TPA: phenylalanine--tRNA ligase subunit beta [Caldimonas sp.]